MLLIASVSFKPLEFQPVIQINDEKYKLPLFLSLNLFFLATATSQVTRL